MNPQNSSTSRLSNSTVVFAQAEGIAFQATLDKLRQIIPFAQAMISTTLPRGGLQVIQPRQADPNWTRAYSREFHLFDVLAWDALSRKAPRRLSDVEDAGGRTIARRFAAVALAPVELAHYAAAQLADPLLQGYPGALQLFRHAGEANFTAAELERLGTVAAEVDQATAQRREERMYGRESHPLVHELPCRQIVIGGDRQVLFPLDAAEALDPAVRENLLEAVERRLEAFIAGAVGGPRRHRSVESKAAEPGQEVIRPLDALPATKAGPLMVPDQSGDHWTFRLVLYEFFPALTRGGRSPVAVVSLPPECDDWARLQGSDIEAETELARLIPALQFMQQNFTSGINLTEVARSVHLSPFHFHRRFTELLGTTPKHFLFDCQIAHAKRHLARGDKPLGTIAQEAGFAHQSHFTSRFRQATGLTPTKWKRLAAQAKAGSSPEAQRT